MKRLMHGKTRTSKVVDQEDEEIITFSNIAALFAFFKIYKLLSKIVLYLVQSSSKTSHYNLNCFS